MLFDVWGSDTLIHWAGWAMVFIGLIVLNEVGRNPYKQDVFEGTSDWEKATARRAKVDYAHAE